MDNIKECISLPMPELLTGASCRKDWKRISAELSVMSPQQPNRSRDWTELSLSDADRPDGTVLYSDAGMAELYSALTLFSLTVTGLTDLFSLCVFSLLSDMDKPDTFLLCSDAACSLFCLTLTGLMDVTSVLRLM